MIAVYYLAAYILLVVYGAEVCPYLESLGTVKLALNMALFVIPVFLLRMLLVAKTVSKISPEKRPMRQFRIDLGMFFLVGVLNTAANFIFLKFPPGSGIKIILGYLTIGFFASIDSVLLLERRLLREYSGQHRRFFTDRGFFSMPRKFALVTITAALFVSGVIVLLVIKDFQWLQNNLAQKGLQYVKSSVLKEIFFVLGAVTLLGVRVLYSYSKNLRRNFENQTTILEQVSAGVLDNYVPVVSNDEFGMIAGHTNGMIDSLREKKHISEVFGKIINPSIAERLLAGGEGKTSGERRELVVLFSDIRNFTSFSEGSDPETLLKRLNGYFSAMVPIIHRHDGIVDKFIGDGMLAFFGLDGRGTAARSAVQAGKEMLEAIPVLNRELSLAWRIGIGIHLGETVAGMIGSPDRMEFTVIGDPVNTASRIESLNKVTGTGLLISEVVRNRLSVEEDGIDWKDYGEHILKGKSEQIRVFGINAP